MIGEAIHCMATILLRGAAPRGRAHRLMRQAGLPLICLLLVLAFPRISPGADANNYGTVSLYWENDALAKTDSNYTNGVKLTWISPWTSRRPDGEPTRPGALPWYETFINALPFDGAPGFRTALFLAAGHNIYTPNDLDRSDLIVDDRPYAGYAYLGIGFLRKGERYMDTLEVDVGIVGRHSYAQDLQEEVHKWLGNDEPRGWANQLSDEPALEIIYERKWKLLKTETGGKWGFDLIPHAGAGIGNVAVYANAGAEFRYGWNRPNDYGTCPIRPGCETGRLPDDGSADPGGGRYGFFFFLGADGRAVLHDIFLDGNTFEDSHSVKKKPFVADLSAGLGFALPDLKVTYSVVYRTKQFDSQPRDEQVFGSLLLSWYY